MSEQTTIVGNLLDETAVRDAIHFALAPVVGSRKSGVMMPGTHVGLDANGEADMAKVKIGIVDPFLTSPVNPGQRFWLFLYPNTVTGLRHQWTHPAFGEEVAVVRQPVAMTPKSGDTLDELIIKLADKAEETGDLRAEALRIMVRTPEQVAESEAWLRAYAERLRPYDNGNADSYREMMEDIRQGTVYAYGSDLHSLSELDDAEEFFKHLAVVRGQRIDPNDLTFSCSC